MWVRYFALAAAIGVTLTAGPVAAAERANGINARQQRQAARIRDGVKDGQLTRGEVDRLRGDEAAIRAEERVYRKSGQGLNRAERADLQHDLNRTSREIYRAKHNARRPS